MLIDLANTNLVKYLQVVEQMCYFLMYNKSRGVPLGIAAEMGHMEVVKRLLKAKANVNFQNKVVTSQDN